MATDVTLLDEFAQTLSAGLLKKWYPLVVDREEGGFFTNVTSDWQLSAEQEKMIVTQARHVWTTARVARFTDQPVFYEEIARHGYRFLRERMWDHQYGGFYQIRDRKGGKSEVRGWRDEKRAYGNAFGVYALAALYERTGDPEVLEFATTAFHWIEEHAFDRQNKGYFEFLTREGNPFDRASAYTSIASDRNELGFKDQNSSIHLLEAYTELFRVWNDEQLRGQLVGLLTLIRDTMVHPRGYLQLFFHPDWTPVSFKDAPEEVLRENYGLDHVSFGHDYETAFLMLEASHALGLENDRATLTIARRMLDHALANGWDTAAGGFYDGGYYFEGEERCRIIRDTKNWWAQAEALNALLVFARIFPEGPYEEYFLRQWDYVKRYVLDHEKGDWYEGGIDKEPHFVAGPKSHIWKCTYHTSRALMNCMTLLVGAPGSGQHDRFTEATMEMSAFIDHWRETARGNR